VKEYKLSSAIDKEIHKFFLIYKGTVTTETVDISKNNYKKFYVYEVLVV